MTKKSTPSHLDLQPRDLKFSVEFVQQGPRKSDLWVNKDLVETHFYNALSLTFPEGEKFFIESVRNFRHLAQGKLEKDIKDFILQEAYHSREHLHFNKHLDPQHYPIEKIETLVKKRLGRARSRGPRIMLAATTVLEHFTSILAADLLKHPELFEHVEGEVKKMWFWHALEESEHKGVAFDLWQLVQSSTPSAIQYLRRLRALIFVSVFFMANVSRITLWLMAADNFRGPKAWYSYLRFLISPRGLVRRHFRLYIDWLRPGFHPWDHDNRKQILEWRDKIHENKLA